MTTRPTVSAPRALAGPLSAAAGRLLGGLHDDLGAATPGTDPQLDLEAAQLVPQHADLTGGHVDEVRQAADAHAARMRLEIGLDEITLPIHLRTAFAPFVVGSGHD